MVFEICKQVYPTSPDGTGDTDGTGHMKNSCVFKFKLQNFGMCVGYTVSIHFL